MPVSCQFLDARSTCVTHNGGRRVEARIEKRGESPFGGSADGDTLTVQVFAQAVVQLCQTSQLEIGHGLTGPPDLRWVAHLTGCVLRHLVGG